MGKPRCRNVKPGAVGSGDSAAAAAATTAAGSPCGCGMRESARPRCVGVRRMVEARRGALKDVERSRGSEASAALRAPEAASPGRPGPGAGRMDVGPGALRLRVVRPGGKKSRTCIYPSPRPCCCMVHIATSSCPPSGQAYAGVCWVLSDTPLDIETELALGFLDYLLLGTPAAPLRKVGVGQLRLTEFQSMYVVPLKSGPRAPKLPALGTRAAPVRKAGGHPHCTPLHALCWATAGASRCGTLATPPYCCCRLQCAAARLHCSLCVTFLLAPSRR